MSVMLQSLNNIRTLRAMAREFSIDVLEEMLEKFRVVTKERREEEEQQQRELAERQEKISTWLELMKADGINPEELLGNSSAAAPRAGKNASRVRRNINSPMLTVKLKPGPVRAVHRSQLLRRWQKVNLSTIS
ncbi:DNA-binding protein [Escherichia coli]|uniref:DNA-binding protein n=1 Tax=Escherichia coli TaxID=562 RepID=A0A376UF40_ECOLX|nr:DNA binding protein, nucleoid-associated [Escherichia coli O104:H4 str. 01-09591]STI87827.1 DNA-binding protein [Escherichia coli]